MAAEFWEGGRDGEPELLKVESRPCAGSGLFNQFAELDFLRVAGDACAIRPLAHNILRAAALWHHQPVTGPRIADLRERFAHALQQCARGFGVDEHGVKGG